VVFCTGKAALFPKKKRAGNMPALYDPSISILPTSNNSNAMIGNFFA
jgi:hypothetical protein